MCSRCKVHAVSDVKTDLGPTTKTNINVVSPRSQEEWTKRKVWKKKSVTYSTAQKISPVAVLYRTRDKQTQIPGPGEHPGGRDSQAHESTPEDQILGILDKFCTHIWVENSDIQFNKTSRATCTWTLVHSATAMISSNYSRDAVPLSVLYRICSSG